ncbi:fumarylacetoacetate hydrolase family protein [Nocardia pseudovaccinii]|uniref:fumarylacetoacetate hydrolase family protein n=1 Tax=Nocardia pseudovaccinii TaxID=189540 RepID=UPI003D8D8548
MVARQAIDATTPLGPELVTPDEVDPRDGPRSVCRINGTNEQTRSTDDLVFDAAAPLSCISAFTMLRPRDVVLTGTAGVSASLRPAALPARQRRRRNRNRGHRQATQPNHPVLNEIEPARAGRKGEHDSCVGCGVCDANAHAAVSRPSTRRRQARIATSASTSTGYRKATLPPRCRSGSGLPRRASTTAQSIHASETRRYVGDVEGP